MSNENNYEFNNEERGAHEGQSGHGAKRDRITDRKIININPSTEIIITESQA